MRIALFTDTFPPDVNGVAKTLERWVRYLERRGAECKVFAPQKDESDTLDSLSVERFYSIPFALYPECRFTIPNPLQLSRTFKSFRPSLVHVATPFNLGLLGNRFALKHGIPLVASYHTNFDQYLPFYKIQWIEPILWRYMHWFHQGCRKVYVPSRTTLDYLAAKGFAGLEIWSRGVDTDRFRPHVDKSEVLPKYGVDPAKFVVLYVGRIAGEKNIDVLLDVIGALPDALRRNAHFILAGDGPLFQMLSEQYKGGNISFLGYVEGKALADLYAASDVFLFPSEHETFGNVVLEAMASGTPVVGARAGGVKDIVQHGTTGFLCEPGDIAAYVEAVCLLYEQPELRRAMALSGREYSLRQSWDAIFARLYASYEEVLGGASGVLTGDAQITG
ncbi:glycosyl transferase [Gordoniibacillus kamchatkensis]|uniref:Glycosyl transferase n=1 Tax=Gordoniibacillus kamchatkensis TaxID=1590651 RepID=A0ABR5AD82_9BACL|nr:glycosyltransferase family 1 protein [Paenibacillus sp. VKM B-2647]KIL38915.1 glycosyl transferase [Paenibacillus sp. VKM B-2647]